MLSGFEERKEVIIIPFFISFSTFRPDAKVEHKIKISGLLEALYAANFDDYIKMS